MRWDSWRAPGWVSSACIVASPAFPPTYGSHTPGDPVRPAAGVSLASRAAVFIPRAMACIMRLGSRPGRPGDTMAKPNFHDRSWHDIDWETWGSQFSIVDRASSIGELQNGITTRYMEVQDLLSQLPPHAGRAQAL